MNQCKVAFNIVITSTLTNPLPSNPAIPMPGLTYSYAYLRCLHIENDWRHNKELFTNKCRPTVSLRQFIPPGDFFVVIYPGDFPRLILLGDSPCDLAASSHLAGVHLSLGSFGRFA